MSSGEPELLSRDADMAAYQSLAAARAAAAKLSPSQTVLMYDRIVAMAAKASADARSIPETRPVVRRGEEQRAP
jgi:hypothetical protein